MLEVGRPAERIDVPEELNALLWKKGNEAKLVLDSRDWVAVQGLWEAVLRLGGGCSMCRRLGLCGARAVGKT